MAFTITNEFKPGNLLFLKNHHDYIMVDYSDFDFKDIPPHHDYLAVLFYANDDTARFCYRKRIYPNTAREYIERIVLELKKQEINKPES